MHETVAEHTHHAAVVEDAAAAAQAGLAVAKDIPGKANTGSKAIELGPQGVFRHTRIAGNSILPGEEYSRRRVGIHPRSGACGHGGEIDLRPAVPVITPGKGRLPTQSQVQSQTRGNAIVVLNIQA